MSTHLASGGCELSDATGRCGAPVTHSVSQRISDGDTRYVCEEHLDRATTALDAPWARGVTVRPLHRTSSKAESAMVTHAGVLLVRLDGGEPRVLLTQRSYDESDAPDVRETWECPGGGLDTAEDPWAGAVREFGEEVGIPLPEVRRVGGWTGPEGAYLGFIAEALTFPDAGGLGSTEVQSVGWFTLDEIEDLPMRPEFTSTDVNALVRSVTSTQSLSAASSRRLAHDSGDNAIVSHCCFCGSGAVVGSSNGTISCEFCHNHFTVQVQPAHPFMPQTVNGQPTPAPGMPGDVPEDISQPRDNAIVTDESGEALPGEFRTDKAATLSHRDYLDNVALRVGGKRMLGSVRGRRR